MSDALNEILAQLAELRRNVEGLQQGHVGQAGSDLTNAKLAAIVESSDDAIISKDLNGIVMTWNSGAQRIFGYTAAEMVGRSIQMIVPPERASEEPEILARLRRGERVDHLNTIRMTKDGRRIHVSVTISPICDSQGRVMGASKIARDVTRERQIENELKRAKEQAELANASKDHFLAVLSHELRTPLMPVLAGLSLIENNKLSPQEMHAEIATMRRNIELESQLIDDLLDHTRINRGKIQLHREKLDLHPLIFAVVRMCGPEISAKNLLISQKLAAENAHVFADPKRIQQVLWNLLKNAVKFTPKGGEVTIETRNAPATATQGNGDGREIILEIKDSGIGIAPELIDRVFNPFDQGEQSIARRFGGLGLGLSISKSFVELHHGKLAAASRGRGKGATFIMTLPCVAAAGSKIPEPATPPAPVRNSLPRPLRLLLVEDHADTRRLLTRLLRDRGFAVEHAGSVAQANQLLDSTTFDVLVSDVGLPDGTGMQVMQHARRSQSLHGIAVSGFGSPEDLRQSNEAGFQLHLTKPIDVEKLEAAILSVGAAGAAGGVDPAALR